MKYGGSIFFVVEILRLCDVNSDVSTRHIVNLSHSTAFLNLLRNNIVEGPFFLCFQSAL